MEDVRQALKFLFLYLRINERKRRVWSLLTNSGKQHKLKGVNMTGLDGVSENAREKQPKTVVNTHANNHKRNVSVCPAAQTVRFSTAIDSCFHFEIITNKLFQYFTCIINKSIKFLVHFLKHMAFSYRFLVYLFCVRKIDQLHRPT